MLTNADKMNGPVLVRIFSWGLISPPQLINLNNDVAMRETREHKPEIDKEIILKRLNKTNSPHKSSKTPLPQTIHSNNPKKIAALYKIIEIRMENS